MEINGKTSVCGLLGNPVEHTLSPVIHNTLAKEFGHNLVYVPFLVENVKQAVLGADALHILGLNVTVPHKSAVIPYLQDIDPLAKAIGAVNTLVKTQGGYKGYNTDMSGLLRAMRSEGITLANRPVVILGAGGAARAVAFMCGFEEVTQIYMLNRSLDKAQAVAGEVNGYFGKELVRPMALVAYDELPNEKLLVIQSTSVGLSPNDDDAVITDEAFYERVAIGFDLIYKPFETRFMKLCKERGAQAYNGLKMLLYQGIIAYEKWMEISVSDETSMMIYEKMKKAMGIDA